MRIDNERDLFLDNLYRCYAKRLEDFCLRYIQYQMEYRPIADEAVQDTMLQAVKSYKTIATYSPERLEAWLLVTCRHRLVSALRTYRSRRKQYAGPLDDVRITSAPEHTCNAIDEYLNHMDNKELANKILFLLNDRERRIVQKRYYQEFSPSEIADQEHMTVGAVKAVLARFKEKANKAISKFPHVFFILTVSFFLLMHFIQ